MFPQKTGHHTRWVTNDMIKQERRLNHQRSDFMEEKTINVDVGERDMTLQMGPQHPSTHGVLNLELKIRGDTITGCTTNIGYLHRGIEKLGESKPYFNFIPLTNDIDYLAPVNLEALYVDTVEKLMKLEVSERSQYIRTILCEAQRIASHLLWLGDFCMNLGQHTMFLWTLRERETVLEFIESVCGGRLNFEYIRFGGLGQDAPKNFVRDCKVMCNILENKFEEYPGMVENEIFKARTIGIGIVDKKKALEYGFAGPPLRASGHKEDVRKFLPYFIYDKLDFDIPTETDGDCFARYRVRIAEIKESIKIMKQCLNQLPEGKTEAMGILRAMLIKPEGEIYVRHEMPRGDTGIYLVGRKETKPHRLRMKAAGFQYLQNLDEMVKGVKLADVVAILGSLDPVFGEIDR